MRKTAIAAVLGLLSLGALPASAAPGATVTVITGDISPSGSYYAGHCRLVAVAQETVTGGQDTFTGVLAGAAVAVDLSPIGPHPVNAQCLVKVNGAYVDEADDGPIVSGVDWVAKQTTFTAADTDTVEICMALALDLGGPFCGPTDRAEVPPAEVQDLLSQIGRFPDVVVCSVLAALAPGVPGVVDIDWEGDVYVLGQQVKDCPPYDL